jgi:hypothetical protein
MKYLSSSLLVGLLAISASSYAETELPNFELALGGGIAESEPSFNIDIGINIPISERFSAQVNLNSDYVFDDPIYDDYSTSEFNAIGFYRRNDWRLGGGFGVLEKESRDESFETSRVGIGHLLAAYYFEDITLDWKFANYNEDYDRAVSMELGGIWYPDIEHRVAIFAEDQEQGTGWRIEAFTQPQKYSNQLAYGVTVRDGKGSAFPYIGLEARYYFDRSFNMKERDRAFK